MKKILGLSMAMLMIASCAVGCGDKDSSDDSGKKSQNNDIAGKWEAEKLITDDGYELTDILGIPLSITFQFDLREDGTCIVSEQMMNLDPDKEAPKGTWSADDDTVTIISPDTDGNDKELEFTYKSGYLVAENVKEDAEGALYLVKVDEFTPLDLESLFGGFDLSGFDFETE